MALKKKTSWIPPSKEVQEELFIFGYSCTLFRDDEKALYLDQGKHLIPWMGNESVKIDRYDCRGALHDVRRFVAPPGGYDRFEGLTAEEKRIEELCDEERYMALYKDEDEEALYHEEEIKRLQQELSKDPGYAMVGFSYDEPGNSQKRDEEDLSETPIEGGKVYLDDTYVPPPDLDVPPGMAVPPTKKLNAIIQRTAVFIAKQGRQMEIVLKTKQAKNPQFGFLNFDHPLHPFYCHVIKMVQGGKYEPPPEEEPLKPPPAQPVKAESEHSDEESDGDDHYLHPSLLKGAVKQVPAAQAPEPVKEVKQELLNLVPLLSAAVSKLDESSAYGQLISRIKSHHRQPEKIEAEAKEVEPVKIVIIEPTGELKVIIDKLASYVAKNGRDFEEIVKAKNDPRFDFVKADHMYRPYYDSKVVKYQEMVKGSEPPKKTQEEKKETTKKEAKSIAPISFKLKPKEAEPVKLVPSSIQLGADELEDGEEPVEEEQAEKSRTKQAVSINHAFISKVRPVEAEKPVEVVSGGFGVMKPSKDDLKAESPEPMELDSSSESEEEPEVPRLPEPAPAPVVQSPMKKPPKPKPVDIFAEEEQAEKPVPPPPEPKKASLSIEEYKNRMLKRLNSSLVVESTVETVEVIRPAESRRKKEEGEQKVVEPTRESPLRDRPQSRSRPSESESELESDLDRKSLPSSSSTSSDESDDEKLRIKLLREKRKLALSKWRSEIRPEADEGSRLAKVASPPSPVRQRTPSVEDRKSSPPASPMTSPDSEEQERLLRQRLEEKHRATLQAQSNADEEKKKIERKQKAALLLARLKKEDKLPAVQSLPNLPEHDNVVLSQPQSAPSTPLNDIAMPSSLPTTPVPPTEVLTVESDEDIQIIVAIPGKKLASRKRTSSSSEDGEISSSAETRSPSRRERSASSSSSASKRKSRSRSRHRSKDRSKKKKRDRSKKVKKKRRKDSTKHSSTSRSDRSSRHRKTKRRRKSDDESEERRRDDKKRRRKEKRKRPSSSSSSSSSSDDAAVFPLKDVPPPPNVLDEDSSSVVTSSVVQPTVDKLTEDLRAKVRALISSKPIQ